VPSPLSALRSRASRRAGADGKEESEKDWEWKMDRVFSTSSFLATPTPAIVRITKMTGDDPDGRMAGWPDDRDMVTTWTLITRRPCCPERQGFHRVVKRGFFSLSGQHGHRVIKAH